MQLRTLGDQITQVSLELASMERVLMQIKQRVLEGCGRGRGDRGGEQVG